jgi:glycosyltransferase involved in cell wall biosynthesis
VNARPRVLVVCSEHVGARMAGPAIRALELARALSGDCEVTLTAPAPSAVTDPRVRLVQAGFADHDALLEQCRAHDVVVAQLLPPRLLTQVARLPIRIVADLYNPTVMEVLESVRDRPPAAQARQQRIVSLAATAHCAAADFIVCASEKQRDLWLGGLGLRGLLDLEAYRADPTYRSVIDVVPFGLPEEPPRRGSGPVLKGRWPGIGAQDRVLLWGGGVWNWLDAETPIRAAGLLADLEPAVHLVFLGMGRPSIEPQDRMSAGERAVALARELGLEGRRVHFNAGWVPYEERGAWLLEADLGVSAHHDHLESRFSFRTRLLDCLWAGLPVVATRGDALAELVERHRLGATVGAGDAEGFAGACRDLLEDAGALARARERVAAVAPEYRWSRAAAPLIEFCSRPAGAPARRARGVLRTATAAQYPAIARDVLERRGVRSLAGKLARNLGRSARRYPRRP